MSKPYEMIIFDLGGVLIDWNPRHLYTKIFKDAKEMEHFLNNICTPDWNLKLDRGYSFAQAVSELSHRHPQYRAQIEAYHLRWKEMVLGPFQETVEIFDEVRKKCRVSALSNWSEETFELVKEQFGFLNYFETILISGRENLIKPEKEFYLRLLKKVSLKPEQCFFIDDNITNIKAAEELKIKSTLFIDAKTLREKLKKEKVL